MSAQDAQKEVVSNLVAYAKGGPDAAAAKEQVINIMAAQQHTNHDEAAKRFDNPQAKLQQAREGSRMSFWKGCTRPVASRWAVISSSSQIPTRSAYTPITLVRHIPTIQGMYVSGPSAPLTDLRP
jgi:hypothetical protein